MMQTVFVYNSHSGGGFGKRKLVAVCKKYDVKVAAWIPIDAIREKLPSYIKKGANIAVVGGDGTLSTVAGMIKDTKAILAPLPGGTLNHFTKDVGISQDIELAIKNLKHASVHLLDVASVNNQVYINNSSIGLYPTSLRTRDRLENKIGKWPSAFYAALRALVRLRMFTVTMKRETFRTPFIFIGNNSYTLDELGGAERKALDKGVLSVFVARTSSRWQLVRIALFALIGKSRYLNEFDMYELTDLHVRMKRRRVHVSYDGEVATLATPLEYKIHKKVLKVLY